MVLPHPASQPQQQPLPQGLGSCCCSPSSVSTLVAAWGTASELAASWWASPGVELVSLTLLSILPWATTWPSGEMGSEQVGPAAEHLPGCWLGTLGPGGHSGKGAGTLSAAPRIIVFS